MFCGNHVQKISLFLSVIFVLNVKYIDDRNDRLEPEAGKKCFTNHLSANLSAFMDMFTRSVCPNYTSVVFSLTT